MTTTVATTKPTAVAVVISTPKLQLYPNRLRTSIQQRLGSNYTVYTVVKDAISAEITSDMKKFIDSVANEEAAKTGKYSLSAAAIVTGLCDSKLKEKYDNMSTLYTMCVHSNAEKLAAVRRRNKARANVIKKMATERDKQKKNKKKEMTTAPPAKRKTQSPSSSPPPSPPPSPVKKKKMDTKRWSAVRNKLDFHSVVDIPTVEV